MGPLFEFCASCIVRTLKAYVPEPKNCMSTKLRDKLWFLKVYCISVHPVSKTRQKKMEERPNIFTFFSKYFHLFFSSILSATRFDCSIPIVKLSFNSIPVCPTKHLTPFHNWTTASHPWHFNPTTTISASSLSKLLFDYFCWKQNFIMLSLEKDADWTEN